MDVDIEDILAELDRDTTAVDHSNNPQSDINANTTTVINSSYQPEKDNNGIFKEVNTARTTKNSILDQSVSPAKDFTRLLTIWKNERCAPELLPYPHSLMSRLLARIQEQMERLELISMDFMGNHTEAIPSNIDGSAPENLGNRPVNNNHMLPLICMEAELERIKFVIRSYIRCRLSKIDKFSLYLRQINEQAQNLENNQDDDKNFISLEILLSNDEIIYHQKHSEILLKLFNNTVLKHLPNELQAINDTDGTVSMIDEPDWNKFVFIKVNGPSDKLFELDPLLIKDSDGKYFYSVTIPELNETIELSIGSTYVMRYNVIKDLLTDDKIALI